MIYTYGAEVEYEERFNDLEDDSELLEVGKTEGYKGGTVFKNRELAEKNCPDKWRVYGVKADWQEDVERSGNGTGYLISDSKLVQLEQ